MDVADLIHGDRDHSRRDAPKHARSHSRKLHDGPAHFPNGFRKVTPPSPTTREVTKGGAEIPKVAVPPSPPLAPDASRNLTLPSIHNLMSVADYGNGTSQWIRSDAVSDTCSLQLAAQEQYDAFKGHRGRKDQGSDKRVSICTSPGGAALVRLFDWNFMRSCSDF